MIPRALTVLLCLFFLPGLAVADESTLERRRIQIVTPQEKTIELEAEIARTPSEQARGLMNRTELAPDTGMLFVFENSAIRHFWMKNTLIPLDMIFIGKTGKIQHIHPMAKPLSLQQISSVYPVSAVLEIKGGLSNELGIVEGSRVFYETTAPENTE